MTEKHNKENVEKIVQFSLLIAIPLCSTLFSIGMYSTKGQTYAPTQTQIF